MDGDQGVKQVALKIENMENAYCALNDALQNAMTIMVQKAASEATIALTINIDMPGVDVTGRMVPMIKYKTSVKVPVDVKNIGTVGNVGQLYWDQDEHVWMMSLEGEQIKLE